MRIRTQACVAIMAVAFASSGNAADSESGEFAPEIPPIDQFATVWKRSPFIKETVAVQTVEGLAAKYSISGIASIANQPTVFLLDKANSGDPVRGRIMVTKGTPVNGLELVSVRIDRDPRNSSVVLKQGSQQAVLSFDSTALAPISGGGMVPNPGMVPGGIPQPQVPTSVVPPMPSPSGQHTNVTANPGASAPPLAVPPPPARRIIRPVINADN